jgi:hypothetical protein
MDRFNEVVVRNFRRGIKQEEPIGEASTPAEQGGTTTATSQHEDVEHQHAAEREEKEEEAVTTPDASAEGQQ